MRVRDRDIPRIGQEWARVVCYSALDTLLRLLQNNCACYCWLYNSRDLPKRPSYINRIKLHPSPMVFSEWRLAAFIIEPSFNTFCFAGWLGFWFATSIHIVDAFSMRKKLAHQWEKEEEEVWRLFRGVYETALSPLRLSFLHKQIFITVSKD